MIQFQMRTGEVLVPGPDTRIPLEGMVDEEGEQQYVTLDMIERIVWGEVSFAVQDAKAPMLGGEPVPIKVLVLIDDMSGITLHVPFSIAGADDLARDMTGQQIVVAKSLPKGNGPVG